MKYFVYFVFTSIMLLLLSGCSPNYKSDINENSETNSDSVSVSVETTIPIKEIAMPNVLGMDVDDAVLQLTDSGFLNVSTNLSESDKDQQTWVVVNQNVPAGTMAGENAVIRLECKPNYNIFIKVHSNYNLIFSKYDVNVYFDESFLGKIINGADDVYLISAIEGDHSFTLRNAEDESVSVTKNISIQKNMSYSFDIAHSSKIEFEEFTEVAGIEQHASVMPDLVGLTAEKAMEVLKDDGITNIDFNNSEIIKQASGWDVVSQNIDAGTVILKTEQIVISCQKNDSYNDESDKLTETTAAVKEETMSDNTAISSQKSNGVIPEVPVEAKRAAVVAITNYCAMDVFTDDYSDYDPAKFHSYADTSGNLEDYYQYVESWGEWKTVSANHWHVDGLNLKPYNPDWMEKRIIDLDVTFDGINYIISDVKDGDKEKNSWALQAYDSFIGYTVTPDLVAEKREEDPEEIDHRDDLSLEDAQKKFDSYGKSQYPYGFKSHWNTDLRSCEQSKRDGSWFLKVGVTITNEYGTEMDTVAESTVTVNGVEKFYVTGSGDYYFE
ncbi:MAG: PASTA domain-containing protein [Oscillospiraceae bacterium]|nr:PASTA domain-containing protein [Oscillospiraceae bacterium]